MATTPANPNFYTMVCSKITQMHVFADGSNLFVNEFTVVGTPSSAITAKDGTVVITTIGSTWFVIGKSYRCDLTAL